MACKSENVVSPDSVRFLDINPHSEVLVTEREIVMSKTMMALEPIAARQNQI